MTVARKFVHQGWQFTLLAGLSTDRALWEWRLLSADHPVPLTHLTGWAQVQGLRTWFLGVEDGEGHCLGGVTVHTARSRLAPGFSILRVERFGDSIHPDARAASLGALALAAGMLPRVLRLHVELFARDESQLGAIAIAASEAGFLPSALPRCYDRSAIVELGQPLDAIFAGLHKTARQNIRAATRFPVEIRPLTASQPPGPMNSLLAETFARTGGEFDRPDWTAILRYCDLHPDRSRVVGMYRTDLPDGDQLLAFAWGCFHGNHVQYATAASTRATDLKVPMAYPLAWDLIQWAHRLGASFFDFGGLSAGSHGSGDPLGGISDFKRYFKGEPARVGAEWMLEPSRFAAGWVRLASRVAARLRPGAKG